VKTFGDSDSYTRQSNLLLYSINRAELLETPVSLNGYAYSPTGMFALPNPMSHLSNAAFAQDRLRSANPYNATRRSIGDPKLK
jgi:hypothetical protein